MINFHPDDNILAEYASGTLDTGLAIGVKAHISMCPRCKNKVSELQRLGAAYLEKASSADDDSYDQEASFASLMERIKKLKPNEVAGQSEPAESSPRRMPLPPVVEKLIDQQAKLKWQHVSPSLKQAQLFTGQSKYEICLHKIRRGGKVAEHDHRGLEVTVILDGAFSDEHGTYRKGDFMLREPGHVHRPTATLDQDCICLSVVEAPVRLTGLLGRVINPFLNISPA